MKTLREMMDLIETAQSGRPELRTWGNRATGETHYSVDGVEVSKDRYYQAWRADQKTQGNPDIKEQEVDDTVGFSVNSEKAYHAVMTHFGDLIDYDEKSGIMYAPARVWPKIEMIAFDADGEGAIKDDGIDDQAIDEDQATARMGLMSAMGSNSGAPDRQQMAQQAVERLAQER